MRSHIFKLTAIRPTVVPKNFTLIHTHTFKNAMASYTSLDPSAHPNTGLLASKLFDVSGFKAVVTGGGTGIGLMITQALVANGATVYISGRRKEALDTVVEKYSGKGGPNAGKIIAYVVPVIGVNMKKLIVVNI
jgi:hypothetical protein